MSPLFKYVRIANLNKCKLILASVINLTQVHATTLSLQVRHLACERGDRRLFRNLNFQLSAGQVLQIVGHNGAGKTSLLRILAGLLEPSHGEICWAGQRIKRVKSEFLQDLTYLGHLSGVKSHLTPLENLKFFTRLHGHQPIISYEEALTQLGLKAFIDDPAGHLSAGQQRRIALARLLVTKARLWILDEPLTALDKSGVALMTQMIDAHRQKGNMVILTSHQAFTLDGIDVLDLEACKC